MDGAYDHIQEETILKETELENGEHTPTQSQTLNVEFQEAYQAVVNSPWAASLGGFWGTVKKASEPYIEEAQKASTVASSTATKGWSDLVSRTRAISVTSPSDEKNDNEASEGQDRDTKAVADHPDRPESLTADIVKEAQSIVSRFKSEAARRLKDIERAEDAADEALFKLGNNIKSFLTDAVSIAPPVEITDESQPDKVLFESKDLDGKRIIHTNRLDAQLHVIHSSLDGFMKDPAGPEYAAWCKEFNIESRTDTIAHDLDKYPELRKAMEKLVPERVEYALFWQRYYFLKKVAEFEEQRRKDLLKGAASNVNEQDVAWDEESEDEDAAQKSRPDSSSAASASGTTAKNLAVKPAARPSDVLSQPDSDASYDLVSGAASRAGGSPKELKRVEESDEEDWE